MQRPFPAYEGTEPFIFVCYAHDDAELVYAEIARLRDAGFNIWYDEGISPGVEWSAALAERIQQCAVFLFFVTPRSVEREHCRREVNFALEERCTILPVHLEETQVPAALKLSLSHRQAILKHEHPDKAYEQKLQRALEVAASGRQLTEDTEAVRLQLGDRIIDVGRQRLIADGEEHVLDPKDLSVLLHLVEAAPDLVSTEALLERSWSGTVVGDNALHQVIGRLRRAFGDNARRPSYIETLPKRGYRLMVPVGEVAGGGTVDRSADESAANVVEPEGDRPTRGAVWLGAAAAVVLGVAIAIVWRGAGPDSSPGAGSAAACNSLLQRARYGGYSMEEQLALAEEALALAPDCADALAYKAFMLSGMAEFGGLSPRDGFGRAEEAAEAALAIDQNQPLAHVVLGAVYSRIDLDFLKAMNSYQQAERLGASARDLGWMQDTLLNAGLYEEGLALQQRQELEDPRLVDAKFYLARFLRRLGRQDEAVDKIEELLDLSGHEIWWVQAIGFFLRIGDLERARALLETGNLSEERRRRLGAELELALGNPAPLQALIEDRGAALDSWALWRLHFDLGNFAKHMDYFAVSVERRAGVSWIMDFMYFEHPDYWQTLNAWSVADPQQAAARARRLNEHRQLVANVTSKMYLEAASPELAVVVIPFDSLSSDQDDAYLADGLAIELMTSLKTVPGLRVAPQSSSFYYRDNPAPYSEVGATLNVTHVLEGSVRRGEGLLRVSAGLVEVASGEEVWSDSFERPAGDLLELQAALATAIVDALAPQVSAAEPRGAADVGTVSEAAFDYYMRARDLLRQDNAEDFEKAAQLLEAALDEDPRFLKAYGGLREATLRLPFRKDGDFATAVARAQQIGVLMRQLDPESEQPESVRASYVTHWLARDYDAAEEIARRALARNPTDTRWLADFVMLLKNAGLFEAALTYSQRVNELDPFDPQTFEQIGDMLLALDRDAEALGAYERCLELAPRRDGCKDQTAITLVRLGRAEEARRLYEDSTIPPTFRCVLFDELSACDPELEGASFGSRAAMARKLGRLDVADDLLRKAADQPLSPEIQIRWSKLHMGFRDERPAYLELLERLNLTDAWKTELCRRAQTLTAATGIPVTCD